MFGIKKKNSVKPILKESLGVHCKYCGLRYQTSKILENHENYFCTGRDLYKMKKSHSLSYPKDLVNIFPKKAVILKRKSNLIENHSVDLSLDGKSRPIRNKAKKITFNIFQEPKIYNRQPKILSTSSKEISSSIQVHVLRLKPNQNLYKELIKYVKENDLKAAFVMSCVGNLTKATVRISFSGNTPADSGQVKEVSFVVKVYNEHMEIISLTGTLTSKGAEHLHISLSNKGGKVFGGHVVGELNVFTTAEVVIGECNELTFKREYDKQSGFDELTVKKRLDLAL